MGRIVAVIGASSNRAKFGNKAVRAFLHQGYSVIPINRHERVIEGLTVYRSVLDVPGPIDLATFYVPPAAGRVVLEEVAKKGIGEIWLNPGAESPDLVERARALSIAAVTGCGILRIGENPGML